MQELIIFSLQLVIAFTISMFVVALLKPFLKDVLRDACGTEHSAAFWVRFTQLMMVISPLILVIFFSKAGSGYPVTVSHAYILKQTILLTLVGEFIGLSFVGRIIYRAIHVMLNPNSQTPALNHDARGG